MRQGIASPALLFQTQLRSSTHCSVSLPTAFSSADFRQVIPSNGLAPLGSMRLGSPTFLRSRISSVGLYLRLPPLISSVSPWFGTGVVVAVEYKATPQQEKGKGKLEARYMR